MTGESKLGSIAATAKLFVLTILVLSLCIPSFGGRVSAASQLTGPRFDRISDSEAGAIARHRISFTINDLTTPLGSIKIEFCSNDPIPNTPCTIPPGLDLLSSILENQAGNTGFSIHPSSTASTAILSRFPILPTSSEVTFDLNGVMNPNAHGSYYIRILTYASDDATGAATESGGIAFAINKGFSVASEVPPYLTFCVGASISNYDCASATLSLLDFGDFSTSLTKTVTSQFLVATNAGSGFNVTMTGTTLTSGNNVITALSNNTSSIKGTSQFGLNLRANNNPLVGTEPIGPGNAFIRPNYAIVNSFRFVSNESIAYGTGTTDNRKFTVSYIANISNGQAPGIYATTLSFICLATF